VILIFGAGSGLGLGLLQEFQKREKPSYGFSRRGRDYVQFHPGENHRLDLREPAQWKHFQMIWKRDCLNEKEIIIYLMQGDGLFSPITEISEKAWDEHIFLNLTSHFLVSQFFWEFWKRAQRKILVFANSTASQRGFSESSAYCASKHGASGLAKALREEGKSIGLKVINAQLGAVATSIWDSRPSFSKNEMISVEDACQFLANLQDLPESLYLDSVELMPQKGIL